MSQNLEKIFKKINEKLGEGTVQFLHEGFAPVVNTYSTGSLTLDLALGSGGLPQGRIVEVFGESMSGKTTLSWLWLAEVQRANEGYVAFVDAEHAFNSKLAIEYGVDLERLIFISPKTAEQGLDTVEALVRTGEVRAIVVDSVPALTPSKIAESSMEQQTMALLARLMSTAMQKLNGPCWEHNCTILFINQVRSTLAMYGPDQTCPGGKALPFYSSVRINVKMGEKIKDKSGDIVGRIA